MGPLRSAIQRGDSPVKRGHSAVIAPTAVRPRCDGLFPVGAALRRFPEQRDSLYPRRGCAPCTSLGEMRGAVAQLPARGTPFLTFPRVRGQEQRNASSAFPGVGIGAA